MRIGRPIPAPVQAVCDYCHERAVLCAFGDEGYPYRDDHGVLWLCRPCEAWIGIRARSKRNVPVGRLANAALRDAKSRLHAALEPLVQAKVRRDSVNVFEARSKALRWAATEAGIASAGPDLHALPQEDCERIIEFIAGWQLARQDRTAAHANHSDADS